MKVFLGGTCNDSTWRDELIALLSPDVEYFNPVVLDWTPECQAEEIRQRELCDMVLYVITPKMTGTCAIAEVVEDSNKRPEKTLFCFLQSDGSHMFTNGQMRSLEQVRAIVANNGAGSFTALDSLARNLNHRAKE